MKKILFLLFFPIITLAVEGGFQLKDDEWNGIVHLRSDVGYCSGAVINKQWVLTAAHCVKEKGHTLKVYSGLKGENFLSSAEVHFIDPRYNAKNYNYDVAILKLNNTIKDQSNFKISESKIYHHLLNGQYPPREVLVAGFGLDEKNQLGTRKGAFEKRLGIYPGENYIGSFFTLNSFGSARKGDSGGPVFIITPKGHQIFGVVSGKNSFIIKDEDGDFEEAAIRNAPISSSLCQASNELQKALDFNNIYCQKIKKTEQILSQPPQSKENHLWQAALAVASPMREVEAVRKDVFKRVAVSFSKMDSLMVRKYIKDNLDIIFTERETRKIIRNALNKYENKDSKDKYSTSLMGAKNAILSPEAVDRFIKYENSELISQCGQVPCVQNYLSDKYPDYYQFNDPGLNWDFLLKKPMINTGFPFSKLVCLCYSDNLNNKKIVNILGQFGFNPDFIEMQDNDNGYEITAQLTKQEATLRCRKNSNQIKRVYVDVTLNKNISYSDLNSMIERSLQLSTSGQLKAKKRTSSIRFESEYKSDASTLNERLKYSQEYNYLGYSSQLKTSGNGKTNSIFINEVFQCN